MDSIWMLMCRSVGGSTAELGCGSSHPAAVGPPEFRQSRSQSGQVHPREVERRIDLLQYVVLESAERVRVAVGQCEHAQVLVHPGCEGVLSDRLPPSRCGKRGAECQAEGRSAVAPTDVVASDSRPQSLVRTRSARPLGGAGKSGVDQAGFNGLTQSTGQLLSAQYVDPPAVQPG